ncbi:MAG: hypothetical protein ACLPHP_03760 [Candidatus Sulfotelmatobacter sp.]
MLRSEGVGVLVNKYPAPASIALFSNDLIETQKAVVARIEASGSAADINAETVVQFEGNELVLDHGSLSVNTSRGMTVRVGCLTITPANNAEWTHYDVADLNGKVNVSALKNDVNIEERSGSLQHARQSGHSNRVTVREGEQKSREENCGAVDIKQAGSLPTTQAILNSPYAVGAGIVTIGVLTCWALCRSGNPISPKDP